jgi:hypothetical protein
MTNEQPYPTTNGSGIPVPSALGVRICGLRVASHTAAMPHNPPPYWNHSN